MSQKIDKTDKVVLAYSGGLDTSVIIKWLDERYGCHIIALLVDLGQGEDMSLLREKAERAGAHKVIVRDRREEFLIQYCFPALAAHAVYEGKYLLATALGRPLIGKELVFVAEEEGANAVVHGATGKGNDQVRFDCSVMALNPDLKIIAPLRSEDWTFKSREEEIKYAKRHNIPVPVKKDKPYSLDRNLWGISVECGILEDPWQEPPCDTYFMTKRVEDAPASPEYIIIHFEGGVPTKIDGTTFAPIPLMEKLNEIGARHAIGRTDLVENRLVGIKSREIYEAPGATILLSAHRALEELVLDRDTFHFKESVAQKYAELIYYGLWYSPLRKALDAFTKTVQGCVTGDVRLKLLKGQSTPVGRQSPKSLYDMSLATYTQEDTFDHKAGEKFCQIWGMPLKVGARVRRRCG